MLLHRLVQYAAEHGGGRPFHREREFAWQLELDATGRPRSQNLTPLRQLDERGHPRGVVHTVPSAVRTSGEAAHLAADDAQYVLGWADPDSKADRIARCHEAFVDLTREWAAGTDDPVAAAVWAFYRDGHVTQIRRPDDLNAKDGVLIGVDGRPAIAAPSIMSFWAEEVARRKGGGTSGLCMVCGQVGPLLKTVPGTVPSRLVPLATKNVALVSVNESVFGYGLTKQLGSTPLCVTCGDAITEGLRGVLESPHAMSYGGQDSRLTWWVTGQTEVDAMDWLDQPDPDGITELIVAVHAGRKPVDTSTASFCSLTVGGNVARVVVRDWVEMPLADLQLNVAAWFSHLAMAQRWPTDPPYPSIQQLVRCTGRWVRGERGYARFGAKGADRPEGVHRDLLRSAIRGVPLPPSLLAHLVHRIRTDGRLDQPRAALLRLALTRRPHPGASPMPKLDTSNTTPAYVAGRAFAVIEALQAAAAGPDLNTTYGDRYFAGAVTNPRAAIVSGRRDAAAWLRKLRRKPATQGRAIYYDKKLNKIFDLLDAEPGLPASTSLHEQALFLIGYHHQRAALFEKRSDDPTTPDTSTSGEDE